MKNFIQKHRYLVDYSLSCLLRRKAKNISLLLVFTLIVFFLASVLLFVDAFKNETKLILEHAPQITLQRQVAGRHALFPDNYPEKFGHIRGISEQRLRLWGYYYDAGIKANYTLMVPGDRSVGKGEIVIGASLAKQRSLHPGFFYNLYAADGSLFTFTIKRIIDPKSDLVSSDLILMDEQDFRQFFSIPDHMYTDMIVDVTNPREVINIARKISEKLPDVRPILREEIQRTYDAVFDFRQGIVMVVLSGSILGFFILAWEKASGLSGEEKREIGILKAVGWETSDILKMKFWEGAILSLASFLIGYLAAFWHVFFHTAVMFEPVLKGWSVLYPDFKLAVHINEFQIATLFFFTVFPYILATLIPVWRAATIDPAEVMR